MMQNTALKLRYLPMDKKMTILNGDNTLSMLAEKQLIWRAE